MVNQKTRTLDDVANWDTFVRENLFRLNPNWDPIEGSQSDIIDNILRGYVNLNGPVYFVSWDAETKYGSSDQAVIMQLDRPMIYQNMDDEDDEYHAVGHEESRNEIKRFSRDLTEESSIDIESIFNDGFNVEKIEEYVNDTYKFQDRISSYHVFKKTG